MDRRKLAKLLVGFAVSMAASGAQGQAVRISGLSDLDFGMITDVAPDRTLGESICAFSGLLGGRYSVTASGSGAGGAFTLANGAATLPYEVQWSTTAGRTSGTNLAPGVALTGQTMLLSCPVLQTANASLIVILRSGSLSVATAGDYSGTLTIILSAS